MDCENWSEGISEKHSKFKKGKSKSQKVMKDYQKGAQLVSTLQYSKLRLQTPKDKIAGVANKSFVERHTVSQTGSSFARQ